MKKMLSIVMLFLFIFSIVGCATIFNKKKDAVDFNSDPDTAKVYVNGSYMGETPFTTKLSVRDEYTIEFKKEGYETKTIFLDNKLGGGWLVLDILAGFVPIIIDAVTGDWYELETDKVNVLLEK